MIRELERYRVIIVDDHSLVRQGIKSILSQDETIAVVAEATNGRELLALLEDTRTDLVILDISMPDMNGIEAVEKMQKNYRDVKVLIVTMHGDNQYFYHSIAAGVHGYLMKDDSDAELLKAVDTVRQGKTYISPQLTQDIAGDMVAAFRDKTAIPMVSISTREKQVLRLVVKGYTSRKIAKLLALSPRTVDHHRASLLKKFDMKNTVDLVKYVVKNRLFLDEK